MLDHGKIKSFVKGTLGCGCADALFDDIEARQAEPDEGFDQEFLIGRRLLVRTLAESDKQILLKKLPMLIADGFEEREKGALNRFRLAIFCENPEETEAALLPLFVRLSQVDDRMHMHVLSLGEITIN